MATPTPTTPDLGYQKYVLRWVFRQWETPKGITFHQFVVRVGDWGGYAVIEAENLSDIHLLTTAMAAFTFRLEPVVDTMDAVAVELQAMAWRDELG
jgi:hypothetical protein